MLLFTKLLLAHLIGDFILQPNKWVSDKEKKKEGDEKVTADADADFDEK